MESVEYRDVLQTTQEVVVVQAVEVVTHTNLGGDVSRTHVHRGNVYRGNMNNKLIKNKPQNFFLGGVDIIVSP